MFPSFAAYMERCLYDDESGYYGSGRVEFGGEPHFWTYPRLLSPIFGWALAERIRETAVCWTESGLLSAADRFTILELGGGDGCLARDVLDYIAAQASEPEWLHIAGRLEYVIGELSPSLRIRQALCLQAHIDAGRARVFEADARHLSWAGTFKGIVFCNELIDALPAERLRVHGVDRELAHATDVYAESGLRDMTCDVDFTEVARLARGFGLEVSGFAHQSAIDTGQASREEAEKLDALGVRLSREVGYAPSVARLVAPYVMRRFRRSPCYWLMQLSPPRLPPHGVKAAAEMQPDGKALWTLANWVGREQLESALSRAALPRGIASRLKSCGDIAADLSDAGMLEHYRAVVRLLDSHAWLRPPGAVCT